MVSHVNVRARSCYFSLNEVFGIYPPTPGRMANSKTVVPPVPVVPDVSRFKQNYGLKRPALLAVTTTARLSSQTFYEKRKADMLNLACGAHLLYNCLINPDASNSCTKVMSTKLLGSAVAAFGVRGAMSSSSVFTPSALGYGTSG